MLKSSGPVHLTTIRRSYQGKEDVSHLLRRSFRAGGKVKSQTVSSCRCADGSASAKVAADLGITDNTV